MPIGVRQWGTVVTDFLGAIGTAAEARVVRQIRRLEAEGSQLRQGSKPLRDGVFELVIPFDKMEYRVLYAFHDREAVLLHAFVKKKQKTPKHELDLALDRYGQLVAGDTRLKDVKFN